MRILLSLILLVSFGQAVADDKLKTAIGGGVGGAVGAVIGDELGDRKGAIIGAGVGAAIGAAVTTEEEARRKRHDTSDASVVVHVDAPPAHGRHCPPGQRKKGRC